MRVVAGAAVIATLAAVTGCTTARRGEPLFHSPAAVDAKVVRGEKVFMTHCHQCHPNGAAGLGPAINNKPLPAFMIRLQIRRGMGAMPSFPKDRISEEDADAVAAYLLFLRKEGKGGGG
jgi:mono/diheme cytochrome c family protein